MTVHGQAAWVPAHLCLPAGSTLCGWYSLSPHHISWFLRPSMATSLSSSGSVLLSLLGGGLGQGWGKDMCSVIQSCPTVCDPMDCSPLGSCPWNFPGKNTGVGCHFLLQRIFLTQGSNRRLLHCRQILYRQSSGKHTRGRMLVTICELRGNLATPLTACCCC